MNDDAKLAEIRERHEREDSEDAHCGEVIRMYADRDFLLDYIAALSADRAWRPMSEAKKDGTLYLLAMRSVKDGELENSLEDTEGLSRTIGHNSFDHDGEDRWQYAGWCWDHDHYTEGRGLAPMFFRELPPAPEPKP